MKGACTRTGNRCEQAAVAVCRQMTGGKGAKMGAGAPDMTPGLMASHRLLVRQAMAAVLHRLRFNRAHIEHNSAASMSLKGSCGQGSNLGI